MDSIAKPEELSFDLARRAHEGVSFDPEKRARGDQQSFADDVNGFHANVLKTVTNDEQRAVLDREIQRYKAAYLERYGAYLQASSRVMSTMIAGPANFPTARNRKAGNVADKRRNEFLDWRNRARAAIVKAIANARTDDEKDSAAWSALRKDVLDSLAAIKGIDEGTLPYARPLFVSSIAGKIERLALSGEVAMVERALDLLREYDATHKKPALTSRHKVWAFCDLAKRKAAAQEQASAKGEETVAEGEGFSIVANHNAERVQIIFAAKPDETMRGKLRGAGWNWSPSNGAWQRKLTNAALYSAKQITQA